MKTRILAPILALMLGAITASAQGTLQFTVNLDGLSVVPSTGSSATGIGAFTLDGFTFSGNVFLPPPIIPTGAAIHGPAPVGANANALFQMEGPFFVPPDPGNDPGGNSFRVTSLVLSQNQIDDLLAGLWYVNVVSDGFPNGEIRGQIVMVPEPSTFGLFAVAGIMGFAWRRVRRSAWVVALVATAGTAGAQGYATPWNEIEFTGMLPSDEVVFSIELGPTATPGHDLLPPFGSPFDSEHTWGTFTEGYATPWNEIEFTGAVPSGEVVLGVQPGSIAAPNHDLLPPFGSPFDGEHTWEALTPSQVPEPSTIALVCAGAGLMALRWRRVCLR